MNKSFVAATVLVASLGISGCASNPVSESLSSLRVCTESVRILSDVEEVLRLAMANPMAAGDYSERLGELSAEFQALEPQNPDLAVAHGELAARIGVVLETVDNPSVAGVAELPAALADSESALRNYVGACTP
jgi:hypothetical protein